jgi:signal transduction histidine kinase
MNSETNLQVNQRNQHLERLLEISHSLSASLELEAFLDLVISAATELTGCEAASILEMDEGGDQLLYLARSGSEPDTSKMVNDPLETGIARWVIQNGQPAFSPESYWDGGMEPATRPHAFKGAEEGSGFTTRSLIAVPIIFHGETLGVLEGTNKAKEAHYTEEDLKNIETLASQAAIAIQNSHLLNKVRYSLDQKTQLDSMKTAFIAIASHELRTPLGIILGYATFLRDVIRSDHRAELDIIVSSSLRLKEIIANLANIDNVQRGTARLRSHSISIKGVVEEVMESYHKEAKQKDISLVSDTGTEDMQVEGDSSKIGIALSNIVNNAITFTNPGGHISIVAGSIPGYVKVSVIDDGIGIPAKDLVHIFERFYQVESHLNRKHGGMGLGLSIAKVMVEMHGGHIWAESVEGKGSTFTFHLPINTSRADSASEPDAANETFTS